MRNNDSILARVTLAQRVVLSSGWQRALLAILTGACGALAMAPVDLFIALVIPMTTAVWLIDGSASAPVGRIARRRAALGAMRSAAIVGWCWGFGYFVANLWWLGSAFLVEPAKYAWLLPFGVFGLPAYLALFPAFGFALARLFWSSGPSRILTLAVCLTISEWLRGVVLTGFPWSEYGMALGGNLVLSQAASLIGEHGLTLLAVLLAAAPATLCDIRGAGIGRLRRATPTVLALLALASLAGFGAIRLSASPMAPVAGVKLRVVQPNATIDSDFSYAHKDQILNHYLSLSDRATSPTSSGLPDVTHLVWPESPFPFILSRDADALATIGAALPANAALITGAARLEKGPNGSDGRPVPLYYNAIQVVASGGTIVGSYDKVHLVPFGEYLPWASMFHALGIDQFVSFPGGFTPGRDRRLLHVPGLPPVAPIVCYEAIFSGEVVPRDAVRPGLLLNVTNDAWFGATAGPYQHFAQARLRAVEEGLPLVRSASTGISGVVDPYGRIIASLPIGAENVIDASLPTALASTGFARYGNLLPALLTALLAVLALALRRIS